MQNFQQIILYNPVFTKDTNFEKLIFLPIKEKSMFRRESLNAVSCRITDNTVFVYTSIEPEMKDLKITWS